MSRILGASFVGLVAMASLPVAGLAQSGACEQASRQIEADPALNVANSDRLFVRIQGFPELTSEYRVNADNTISIPVIGRISVAGVTPACLEERLSTAAGRIAKRDVFLTVETVAYKPVYITGAVARPGAAPWFPKMTVLHATTIVGGLYRPPATTTGSVGDPLKMRRLADIQRRLQARLGRLRAELQGAATLDLSDELARDSAAETVALIRSEQTVLQSRNAALQNDSAALKRSMQVAEEEIASLQQSRARAEQQLKMRQAMRDRVQELQQKGYVRLERSLEEDVRVAELEQRVLDNSVARTRLTATLAGLEREASQLVLGRRATLTAEIADLERDLSVNAAEIREARLTAGAPVLVGVESSVVFQIIRRIDDQQTLIEAKEDDTMLVGDVLVVTFSAK